QRLQHFSSFYRTINLGAGIAPVIGFALPYQTHPMLIVFGVVCAFALCFLCISLFFATEVEPTRSHLPFLKLVTAMYHQIGKRLGVFSVFATFGLGVYALTHAHALAFYFKTFFTIPPFMGVLLAVNPILIVIFQKQLSQGFFRLHQKIPQSGFLVGMGFMVCGFLTMALGRSPHAAWGFILFATLGEMLIYPHIDFVLSQKVPRFLMPYLLAMLGLTMAVAQSLADSSAITALSLSAAWQLPPQTWWIVNTIAYAGITGFGIFLLRRRRGHVETTV
ncbi:MAG: hypothetical protein HY540_02740, partial [Deltaproteobacteria bacterium]|nr:hypothetical protein [Deltaproteobacteria bacterium]